MAAEDFAEYFPFNDGIGENSYEDRWRKMARLFACDGVDLSLTDELTVFGDSSGKHVKMSPGAVFVDGFYAENDAEQTITLSDNSSGNPRIDRIVARLKFASETVEFDVLEGTPASTPVAPTVSQNETGDWEVSLARVAVADGYTTVASGDVTDDRPISRYENGTNEPSGIIKDYAGSAAPKGYLLCDGTSYLRALYPGLFAAIGTVFGSADGTHFNVPDLRGRSSLGAGTGASPSLTTRTLGVKGGEENHVLSTAEMPAHTHVVRNSGDNNIIVKDSGSTVWARNDGFAAMKITGTNAQADATGGGGAHNTMHPYLVLTRIIKI